ncbi:hypothetical protein [Arthrobacter bambusae]|uniref:hypothetical protein n=1 Tax=Arthrobacter bambusae TaxID=1338426 RepID=UPI002782A7AA|nr:hypothetical protein [Arthrobacter bambusae]MDQ0213576.1 hypothetical protein [Arthrobacter bambusae]MDQ0237905.1 hypothetical protein [Arthrobacter bambusae]
MAITRRYASPGRTRWFGLVLAGVAVSLSAFLLAGCATGPVPPSAGTEAEAVAHSAPSAGPAASESRGAPSESAKMVCGAETRANIARILALGQEPRPQDAWSPPLYTCTYALPSGALVLSVKEAADAAGAQADFGGLQRRTATARPIEGMANLGLPAFETESGSVVFVKDSFILTVDASALPPVVGPHAVSRSSFAYEVATAVLACWSE